MGHLGKALRKYTGVLIWKISCQVVRKKFRSHIMVRKENVHRSINVEAVVLSVI